MSSGCRWLTVNHAEHTGIFTSSCDGGRKLGCRSRRAAANGEVGGLARGPCASCHDCDAPPQTSPWPAPDNLAFCYFCI